jgi:hypothetical protein
MSEDSGRGTLTRPVDSPRRASPRPAARVAAPRVAAPRVAAPPVGAPRPAVGPRPAGPRPAVGPEAPLRTPQAPPAARRVASRVAPGSANRMPFLILLCALLGGALVSALVISTTLAEGSFQITKLQNSDNALARQQQQLQEEVAMARSAPVIEQRAYELGMRPLGELTFLNLKTGKVQEASSGAGVGSIP